MKEDPKLNELISQVVSGKITTDQFHGAAAGHMGVNTEPCLSCGEVDPNMNPEDEHCPTCIADACAAHPDLCHEGLMARDDRLADMITRTVSEDTVPVARAKADPVMNFSGFGKTGKSAYTIRMDGVELDHPVHGTIQFSHKNLDDMMSGSAVVRNYPHATVSHKWKYHHDTQTLQSGSRKYDFHPRIYHAAKAVMGLPESPNVRQYLNHHDDELKGHYYSVHDAADILVGLTHGGL